MYSNKHMEKVSINNMVIRYIAYGLIFALAYVVGLFIVPLIYPFKYYIRKYNIVPLWWFLNDTKPFDLNDIDWGDYGRFSHNIFGFYQQNAIRNSHWNLKLLLAPKKGIKTHVQGELTLLSARWNNKIGSTYATYQIDGVKYFRYSHIYKVFKWKWNVQLGANDYRYLYKSKFQKP